MKRDEALSLLKDLMVACDSMRFSPVVSLTPSLKFGSWKLSIKWSDDNEKGCFDKIISDRGLIAMETEDGYTVFQKP